MRNEEYYKKQKRKKQSEINVWSAMFRRYSAIKSCSETAGFCREENLKRINKIYSV